ncbi:MAG: hypothetical protein Q7V63_03050 [Gammaproteobacteria bacterium]|nr:hypothetical protein [Gammaproteobacteria bacterium]
MWSLFGRREEATPIAAKPKTAPKLTNYGSQSPAEAEKAAALSKKPASLSIGSVVGGVAESLASTRSKTSYSSFGEKPGK